MNLGAKQCHFCIRLEPKLKDAQDSQDLSPSHLRAGTPQQLLTAVPQLLWVSILSQQHTLVRAARPQHSVWMRREMRFISCSLHSAPKYYLVAKKRHHLLLLLFLLPVPYKASLLASLMSGTPYFKSCNNPILFISVLLSHKGENS